MNCLLQGQQLFLARFSQQDHLGEYWPGHEYIFSARSFEPVILRKIFKTRTSVEVGFREVLKTTKQQYLILLF